MFDKVRADFAPYEIHTLPGACRRTLGSTRLQAIVLMRCSTALHPRAPRVAGLVKNLNTAMTGCGISAAAEMPRRGSWSTTRSGASSAPA